MRPETVDSTKETSIALLHIDAPYATYRRRRADLGIAAFYSKDACRVTLGYTGRVSRRCICHATNMSQILMRLQPCKTL